MSTDEDEKRRYPRALVNRPGRIRFADGAESSIQIMDISEIGASLFYSEAIAVGTSVELRFHVNVGKRVDCIAYGEVKHYYAREQSHVIGVAFTHFDPHTIEAIREFIRKKAPDRK